MIVAADQTSAEKIAARILARYGVAFIWDTYMAATAAHTLGSTSLADDLIEIAEAAERVWVASR